MASLAQSKPKQEYQMEIVYLKKVLENNVLNRFVNKGLSLTAIEEMERQFFQARPFPKAFREYLFLAGDFCNFGFDDIEGIIELQQYLQEDLKRSGQQLPHNLFAFSVYDSQYSVISLVETEEDPVIYLLSPFLAKSGEEPLLKPNGWRFTALVDERIRRIKHNIAF